MNNYFLQTERLYLRKMDYSDFSDLAQMLKNPAVMYAWEYEFTDEDVKFWIDKNMDLYEKYNCGYFLACDKNTNEILGQAAIMPAEINGKKYYEIGYIFKQENWGHGYAFECAYALVKYAFNRYPEYEIIFEIRPENLPSRRVAERIGATVCGEFDKNVKNKLLKHLIYKITPEQLAEKMHKKSPDDI